VDEIREMRRRRDPSHSFADLQLLDFVPAVTPRFTSPYHLEKLASRLARARQEPLRLVVSTPPRHGKTELLLHFEALELAKDPSCQIAYISYANQFAHGKNRKALEIAKRAGVPLSWNQRKKDDWRTGVGDGGVKSTGIGGQLTGEGFHIMVVDDPVKDRKTAESPTYREQHWDWFNDVAFTRLEPDGSCIVNMARWHEDDLAGRLIKAGWEELRLPAISDAGLPLWPDRWTLTRLLEIQEQLGPYGWESLYQGRPRPRGSKVFRDVHYYSQLPRMFRAAFGVDCAYTRKKVADRSVCLTMLESEGVFYVVDLYSDQVESPAFGRMLKIKQGGYPGSPMLWRGSGVEKGVAQHLVEQGADNLQFETVAEDKFITSQPVAAAWNAGKILVPEEAPWLADFLNVVLGFTGVADKRDDEVDALGNAHHLLQTASWDYEDTTGDERAMAGGLGGF
jgi:predicted phage terminase large subunit-like protein